MGIGLFIENILLGFTSVPSAVTRSSSGRLTRTFLREVDIRVGVQVQGSQLCGHRKPIELLWNNGGWGVDSTVEQSFGFF